MSLDVHTYRQADCRDLPQSPTVPIPDRMAFVLDAEMRPVEDLNAWLLALPQNRCQSPLTWAGYAHDVTAWARFLASRERGLFESQTMLRSEMTVYWHLRQDGDEALKLRALGPDAWGRAVTATSNFYLWAADEGKGEGPPFTYRTGRRRLPTGEVRTLQINNARRKTGSAGASIRALTPEFTDLFINVGLGGAEVPGDSAAPWRGRNGVRNAAAGSLIVSSGLRRQEFSNLLIWEVPSMPHDPDCTVIPLAVPSPIAKGRRPRTTWVRPHALGRLRNYMDLERNFHKTDVRWQPSSPPLHVTEPTAEGGRLNGRYRRWDTLSIPDRRRLVGPDGSSPILFLTSQGRPVSGTSWRNAFRAASSRCRLAEPDFPNVRPHMLRHSFAVQTLQWLTRLTLTRISKLAALADGDPYLVAALRHQDPLLILKDLLGHSSLATTQVYLALQDPARILTEAELSVLEADEEDSEHDEDAKPSGLELA